MLSLSSYRATRRVPGALGTCLLCRWHVVSARAREASRGCRRTPANGLSDLENLPLSRVCAFPHFFAPRTGRDRKAWLHLACEFHEGFMNRSGKVGQALEAVR